MATVQEVADYNRKKLIYTAKSEANKKDCPVCKKKDWKIVPLHEFGDPFLPSKVVIACGNCDYNEVYAEAPQEQSRAFAEGMMKGIVKSPNKLSNQLITKKPNENKKGNSKK